MSKTAEEIKGQSQCGHEWATYKQCCYCGAYEGKDGQVIEKRIKSNVEDLRLEFMKWYNGVKETNGGYPPLAIQIFYWFETHRNP